MGRRPFIAGNWKMNLTGASAVALAEGLAKKAKDTRDVDLAVCPASVYLDMVSAALSGSDVFLGAQNMYFEPKGAYTGEISAEMLVDVGCQYVILGHSERRHVFGESDGEVNEKVHAALSSGLMPIVCVGETLEEREKEKTLQVVRRQFDGSLSGVSEKNMKRTVIAYEPVWAIGTGLTATPEQAQQVHADLRKIMASRYNKEVADAVRIQYGGSVKPSNAAELLSQPDIDGALVGGASLKVADFMGIVAGLPS